MGAARYKASRCLWDTSRADGKSLLAVAGNQAHISAYPASAAWLNYSEVGEGAHMYCSLLVSAQSHSFALLK